VWLLVFAVAIVVTAAMLYLLKPNITEVEEEILSLE
jgi:cell division protein FtsL